jgi:hypothetical protein
MEKIGGSLIIIFLITAYRNQIIIFCSTYVTDGNSQVNSCHLLGRDASEKYGTKEAANEEHVGSPTVVQLWRLGPRFTILNRK